jgi:hypothetical protein
MVRTILRLLDDRERQHFGHIYAAQHIGLPVLNRPAEIGKTGQGTIRIPDRLGWVRVEEKNCEKEYEAIERQGSSGHYYVERC